VGYEGARLAPWFDEHAREITIETAHKMAERGGDHLTTRVGELTPQDTGKLKTSWHRKPVLIVASMEGQIVFESGTETDVDYAPYVEHGTGLWGPKHAKYEIRPKKPGGVLHFLGPEGEDVFTKLVMHPGSPGKHMIAIAVAEIEHAIPLLMRAELEEWARRVERANHSGLGAA
jgi:hypothetical protein